MGNPLRIGLTGGNVHDIVPAPDLVSSQSADNLLGDKAYDADQFIAQVHSQGIEVVIPPKSNRRELRNYDRHIYKNRHLVECFFAKIKPCLSA
ncbi:transposase, IS4-like [Desulfosarcina variabilis str. Montpellier]